MLTAHVTDIDEFQIHRIVLEIDHIALAPSIASTTAVRALNHRRVRIGVVEASEFIEQNLVALAGALLHQLLYDEPALLLGLLMTTVTT